MLLHPCFSNWGYLGFLLIGRHKTTSTIHLNNLPVDITFLVKQIQTNYGGNRKCLLLLISDRAGVPRSPGPQVAAAWAGLSWESFSPLEEVAAVALHLRSLLQGHSTEGKFVLTPGCGGHCVLGFPESSKSQVSQVPRVKDFPQVETLTSQKPPKQTLISECDLEAGRQQLGAECQAQVGSAQERLRAPTTPPVGAAPSQVSLSPLSSLWTGEGTEDGNTAWPGESWLGLGVGDGEARVTSSAYTMLGPRAVTVGATYQGNLALSLPEGAGAWTPRYQALAYPILSGPRTSAHALASQVHVGQVNLPKFQPTLTVRCSLDLGLVYERLGV